MNNILIMTVLYIAVGIADTDVLKISDIFVNIPHPIWPSLEERPVAPPNEVARLQALLKEAKESGLLKHRQYLWYELITEDRQRYMVAYCRYSNPEIVDLVVELYLLENECYKKYEWREKTRIPDIEKASCIEQTLSLPVAGEEIGDESEIDYYRMVSNIALSTLAPDIFDIVLSLFSGGSGWAVQEYFSHVNAEQHLIALLDYELETLSLGNASNVPRVSCIIIYTIENHKRRLGVIQYFDLLIHIILVNPSLAEKHDYAIRQVANQLRDTKKVNSLSLSDRTQQRLVNQSNRLERDLERIIISVKVISDN